MAIDGHRHHRWKGKLRTKLEQTGARQLRGSWKQGQLHDLAQFQSWGCKNFPHSSVLVFLAPKPNSQESNWLSLDQMPAFGYSKVVRGKSGCRRFQ